MKMKVRVDKLKAAIEDHVAKDKSRFEKESATFAEKMEKCHARYLDNVKSYVKRLEAGHKEQDRYNVRDYLERGCDWPSKPEKVKDYGDLLERLYLAEDKVVTVDDKSDYMRFLAGKCVCR